MTIFLFFGRENDYLSRNKYKIIKTFIRKKKEENIPLLYNLTVWYGILPSACNLKNETLTSTTTFGGCLSSSSFFLVKNILYNFDITKYVDITHYKPLLYMLKKKKTSLRQNYFTCFS